MSQNFDFSFFDFDCLNCSENKDNTVKHDQNDKFQNNNILEKQSYKIESLKSSQHLNDSLLNRSIEFINFQNEKNEQSNYICNKYDNKKNFFLEEECLSPILDFENSDVNFQEQTEFEELFKVSNNCITNESVLETVKNSKKKGQLLLENYELCHNQFKMTQDTQNNSQQNIEVQLKDKQIQDNYLDQEIEKQQIYFEEFNFENSEIQNKQKQGKNLDNEQLIQQKQKIEKNNETFLGCEENTENLDNNNFQTCHQQRNNQTQEQNYTNLLTLNIQCMQNLIQSTFIEGTQLIDQNWIDSQINNIREQQQKFNQDIKKNNIKSQNPYNPRNLEFSMQFAQDGLDLAYLFQQYAENGLIYFPKFQQMVLFIDPNTEPQLVYKFFQDIDADSNNSINYFEIKQIFDKIDLEKDSPFYIDEQNIKDKEDSRIEDPYQTVLQKIQNVKQMNDKNQINVENAIKIFSNYQPYIDLYNLIEMIKSFGININNAEIHEIEKIFGYGQIDINTVMVQFLGLRNPLFDPNEKHNSQQQKMKDIPVNPLEQEIIDKLKIKDNKMDIEKENEEQIFLNQSKIKIKQDIQKIQQNQFQNNPNQFQFNFDSYYQIDQMIPGIESFLNIFNFSIANSHHFVDDSFPPCPNSICNDQNDLKFYKTRDKYYWKEPKNIFKGQIYIFQKKQTSLVQSRVGIGEYISPRDIKQGNLGDCYFLSCLSSMAEKPERILKLFITKIYNKFGVYCVKLCHNGKLKAITVDDKFPCHNKYSGPAFSKANGNELWVLLLEKAYAKMYGSYSRIEGGYSQEAYFDLTGAPAYSVHTQNFKTGQHNEKIYDELVYALNFNQFLVNAATSHDITSQISKQIGLIGGHAYSILNVYMVEHPKLGQTFLVKLRNPWGKTEWKGDFSDNSDLWTPQLKKQFKINNLNDGIFYMKLFDFQSYFSSIQICCYHDDYIRKDIELLSHRKKGTYLFFDIKKEGLYYVTLTQQSKRNLPKKSNYKYSNTQLLLAKMLPDHTFRFYEASQKTEQNNTISSHLTEGRYYIYAKTEWKHKEQDNMVVGVYGPEEVQIMQIEKAFIQDMVEESIKNWASQQGKLSPIKGYPYINGAKHFDMKKGFGYLYMVNKSNHIFKDTITMSQLSGLKARKPFRNNVFKTCLMPNSEVIIVFKVDPLGYSYQLKEQYQIQN